MDEVNEIVLESALVILTGGRDLNGTPLITFAADSADLLDIYSAGDILRLIKVYNELAGGTVAVVADLKHGWTEECITKLTYVLDELQVSEKNCIKVAYLVHPHVNSKQKILHRNLSRLRDLGRMIPKYEVKRVEDHKRLYNYIDQSQLTHDYGGSLQYNHGAWVTFQKTYSSVIERGKCILKLLQTNKLELVQLTRMLANLDDYDWDKFKKTKLKFEELFRNQNIHSVVENCDETLEKLEHPEFDPSLNKVSDFLILETVNSVRNILHKLNDDITEISAVFEKFEEERRVYEKLQECEHNQIEILETIELMQHQLVNLPHVASNLHDAQKYRNHFGEHILTPSKDIIACAASVLEDLNIGLESSSEVYTICFRIANTLTDAIQSFTKQINQLNETYTRIHLFFVMFHKTQRWKYHAKRFMNRTLLHKLNYTNVGNCACEQDGKRIRSETKSLSIKKLVVPNILINDTDMHICKTAGATKRHIGLEQLELPANWSRLVSNFHKKHPPPKKKHIRLLTKFVPRCVDKEKRNEAATLAERTLFIQAIQRKIKIKAEDMIAINSWIDDIQDFISSV